MTKEDLNKKTEGLRDSFEDLIGDEDFLQEDVDNLDDMPPVVTNQKHDYVDMKSKAVVRAKKTINSLMRFYLSEDVIAEEEYVRAKQRIDEMTLGSLIFQLETAEMALVTLLSTIDSGELAPRMFEVLATLQKSMLDIIKSQTMYLMAAEEGIKKVSRDIDIYSDRRLPAGPTEDKKLGHVIRGSKKLMQEVQDEIQQEKEETPEDIEDITEEVKSEDIDADNVKPPEQ